MASDVTAIVSGIRGVAIMPRVLFNSSLDINLYFKDAAGNFLPFSGDNTNYTPNIKIRQPRGFNAIPLFNTSPFYSGTIVLGDGSTSRTITFGGAPTNWSLQTAALTGVDGLLGGYSGVDPTKLWVFNGGSGGAGVSAAAVWAATRVTARGTPDASGQNQNGTLIIEADSTGVQAALAFSSNAIWPAVDATVNVLRAGAVGVRALVLLRITPAIPVSAAASGTVTNGWTFTIPFTDPSFISISNTANITVSEFQDYDVEITVTKNSDSTVACVAVAKVRVFRKQISLVI